MGTYKSKIALGLILLAGLALRVVFIEASAPMDDAYITFRYAQNLASGHGFVYNVGDRVLGVTTPLFALILAPFAMAGIPLDAAALGLAVVLDLLMCVLLYRLLREYFGEPTALVAAFFYSIAYTSLAASGYGMETQLFNFLLVASLLLLSRGKYSTMGIVVGLAVLTRPEGILLAGLLGALVLLRQLRGETNAARNSLAAFLGVTAPWFVFALLFFGSPIPNSLTTKLLQKSITVRQWLDFFIMRNPFVIALWVGAAVGFVVGLRRKCEPCAVLGLWAVAYLLFHPRRLRSRCYPPWASSRCSPGFCGAPCGGRSRLFSFLLSSTSSFSPAPSFPHGGSAMWPTASIARWAIGSARIADRETSSTAATSGTSDTSRSARFSTRPGS